MAAPTGPSLFKVNLLIHREEQEKLYHRLIKWALSSGRFIIIVVEMVTIGAFVYRYKLDADLVDIQDQINDKIPYIKNLADDEILLKQTQFQLTSIKQVRSDRANYVGALQNLAQITPKSIKLTNISLDRSEGNKTAIVISGQTPSNIELSAFIKALQKDATFTDIALTNIAFDIQTSFTITGNLSSKMNQLN